MAFSVSTRRLCRSFLSNPTKPFTPFSSSFSTHSSFNENTTTAAADVEGDVSDATDSVSEVDVSKPPVYVDRPLENGLDYGIYKAILVGQVGQNPIQKKLRSGRTVTLLSIGTGGIRNNRRPLENEEPKDYANRCAVQWHRVSIYREKLGDVAIKHVTPGSILYLEGNLETKVFSDPVTGLVRRIREVAIRQTGQSVAPASTQTTTQVDWPQKDAEALAKIHLAVTDAIFPRIMNATSAKEAWDILKAEFDGNEKTTKIRD